MHRSDRGTGGWRRPVAGKKDMAGGLIGPRKAARSGPLRPVLDPPPSAADGSAQWSAADQASLAGEARLSAVEALGAGSGDIGSGGSGAGGDSAGGDSGPTGVVRGGLVAEEAPPARRSLDRRSILRWAGTAAVAAPAAGLLAACGGSSSSGSARALRLGYVTSRTGTFSEYSQVDSYIVKTMRTILAEGVKVGDRTYPVQIFVRDSQSDRSRAGIAATDLIFKDKVDIVLVGGTSDTAIPVADQCEINQVPCISTLAPWQSWWNGRGGNVDMPFSWTYHFFWGMQDLVGTYVAMWRQLGISKVGLLYPDDDDGHAFANPGFGLPTINNFGLQLVSPVATGFQPGTANYSDFINGFKSAKVDAVVGVAQPADFALFRRAGRDANLTPRAVTMSKALYFREDVKALGSVGGDRLTTEVAWSPSHPFRSSLTNRTSQDLANDYGSASGQEWTQALGYHYALFEVAVKAVAAVDSIDNRQGIAAAIRDVDAQTIVGQVAFGAQSDVPKNVARTALVGGQWDQVQNDFTLKIVNNAGDGKVPTNGTLEQVSTATV